MISGGMMLIALLSFVFGALFSGFILHLIYSKKNLKTAEELVLLRAKLDSTESLQEIIKRDFVHLANETIKKE